MCMRRPAAKRRIEGLASVIADSAAIRTADDHRPLHWQRFEPPPALNSQSNPAEPGSIVVVYGTGAGVTTPAGDDGALVPIGPLSALPRPAAALGIWVQGIRLTPGDILYAGAAPGLVNGLTQVNFRIRPAPGADSEPWRSPFRTDVDHDSEVMPISIPN